ncbi:MAG: pyridoxal 5'-phosphate synthase glutaminase subunit PdxT [Spirochaetes bacterium]|nr:MAG: pyridoxal 5'-phosphate synthase glutaminase subunit PdxT [Spirochaetota bacterium]
MPDRKTIGVLALQGAFARHIDVVESLGAAAVEVRDPDDLPGIDALIIPGGESTAMSKMLVRWGLIEPLQNLIQGGLPVFGTCAGLILMADRLKDWDALPRLGGLNVTVARNAYGRQLDSFEASLNINIPGSPEFSESVMEGIFIRAPRIPADGVGSGVEVLCSYDGFPVLVRQNNIVGAAFHPELTGDNRLHEWFLRDIITTY